MPKRGLITVYKVGNRSVTVYRSKVVKCQLYIPLAGS
jgi:hypothetical protein